MTVTVVSNKNAVGTLQDVACVQETLMHSFRKLVRPLSQHLNLGESIYRIVLKDVILFPYIIQCSSPLIRVLKMREQTFLVHFCPPHPS
jgi:hypothetical protein